MTKSKTSAGVPFDPGQKDGFKRIAKTTNANTVPVNQTYDKDIYKRLDKYRRDHGYLTIQEVDRLAVSFFLNKNGY